MTRRFLLFALLVSPFATPQEGDNAPVLPGSQSSPSAFQIYARSQAVADAAFISTVDEAVRPFGYVRYSSGTRDPRFPEDGVFAFYRTERPSALLILTPNNKGCTSLAVSDYAKASDGHAANVGAAIRDTLARVFPGRFMFYSDDHCTHAL
jgi:hypothetical protein